jgi:hypothetical protein
MCNSPNIRELIKHANSAFALYDEMTKRLEAEQPGGGRSALSALQESACGTYADAATEVFEAIPDDAGDYLAQAEFIAAHYGFFSEQRAGVAVRAYEQIIEQYPEFAV